MSQSLLAFDTDHIKRYVFGTNKLREIRGASSLLDALNRFETPDIVKTVMKLEDAQKHTIYAHGGSALFVVNVDSDKAEEIGKQVQKLYHERTGGGASITYSVQPIPADYDPEKIMTIEMPDILTLLSWRLKLAKDGQQLDQSDDEAQQEHTIAATNIAALPSHPFFYTCSSCGANYANNVLPDPDNADELGCQVCRKKRDEDRGVKRGDKSLWDRILSILSEKGAVSTPPYTFSPDTGRPKDFDAFRRFAHGKDYLGLIYADANGMGNALAQLPSLEKRRQEAKLVDDAVFAAMADAIIAHLPVQGDLFPFDILLIGGDDIVMITPADKALQVAYTLADKFYEHTHKQYTLSVGVVLAPIKYPFGQQYELVGEALKAAKTSGAQSKSASNQREYSHINFIVITGNTSLNYKKVYEEMYQKNSYSNRKEEFYATMRPYSLSQIDWLLKQLEEGKDMHLGRTKLHQLRQAILKCNNTTSILEALALLRNWQKDERKFIKGMVNEFDTRQTPKQKEMGVLFPWSLDGKQSNKQHAIYRTPLLDFVELYDFVSF